MNSQSFASRLAVLLAADIMLTIVGAYIPQGLGPIRTIVAGIELLFMIATMAVAVRYALEDF